MVFFCVFLWCFVGAVLGMFLLDRSYGEGDLVWRRRLALLSMLAWFIGPVIAILCALYGVGSFMAYLVGEYRDLVFRSSKDEGGCNE